jgi:hypothetical protein
MGRRAASSVQRSFAIAIALTMSATAVPRPALADEDGISFWLPGNFGSLAAAPGVPGWAWATIYYHTSVSAAAGASFPRGGRVDVGIRGQGDIAFFGPSYIFAPQVLGGQLSATLLAFAGRNEASADLSLTGPRGNTLFGTRTQALTSVGDLIPTITLKWNQGVNNFMVYGTGDIPVGDYDPNRLANIGIGHGAIDGGAGYTYLDPKAGHEFSVASGLTYNFRNTSTDYQNGIDWHVDWAASQFLTKQVHIGLVGYYFQQLTGDSGSGATLGAFKSRVAGVGPQVGFIFPLGAQQLYINLKGFKEFDAQNRPEGWNAWLTLSIANAAPEAAAAKPVIRK